MIPNEPTLEIEGYATVWGIADLAGDRIRRGAFANTLLESQKLIPAPSRQVRMLYQHAADRPIGRWLQIREDETGLHVKGYILETTDDGRNAAALVRAGALDGLSIGFRPRQSRRRREGGRDLFDIDLWEISLVTFPMNRGARIHFASSRLSIRSPRNLLKEAS